MMSKTWLFLLCIFALSVQPVTAESKTETLEIDSIGEALPAVNADLVGTQQHLFRKREQIQQDEHLKDGTWGQYDNGVGSGGQSPDRNNQNGDGTDGLGSGQKNNDNSDQGVSLLGSGYNPPIDARATMNSIMYPRRRRTTGASYPRRRRTTVAATPAVHVGTGHHFNPHAPLGFKDVGHHYICNSLGAWDVANAGMMIMGADGHVHTLRATTASDCAAKCNSALNCQFITMFFDQHNKVILCKLLAQCQKLSIRSFAMDRQIGWNPMQGYAIANARQNWGNRGAAAAFQGNRYGTPGFALIEGSRENATSSEVLVDEYPSEHLQSDGSVAAADGQESFFRRSAKSQITNVEGHLESEVVRTGKGHGKGHKPRHCSHNGSFKEKGGSPHPDEIAGHFTRLCEHRICKAAYTGLAGNAGSFHPTMVGAYSRAACAYMCQQTMGCNYFTFMGPAETQPTFQQGIVGGVGLCDMHASCGGGLYPEHFWAASYRRTGYR